MASETAEPMHGSRLRQCAGVCGGTIDVTSPSFLAPRRMSAARATSSARALALLAATACGRLAQARSFHAWRLTRRLAAVTALGEGRAVGCELDALAGQFLERLIPFDA